MKPVSSAKLVARNPRALARPAQRATRGRETARRRGAQQVRIARDVVAEHDVDVIRQVLADRGQHVRRGDAEALEVLRIADAGQLQQLRRQQSAGAQDHLAPRVQGAALAALQHLHPDRAAPLEQDARGLGPAQQVQVRPPSRRSPAGDRAWTSGC
jgi:hypothetical protein